MFTKNRERLIEHDVVVALFNEIVAMADAKAGCRASTSAWTAH